MLWKKLRDAPVDWLRELAALFVYDGTYGDPKQYGLVERMDGTSWATAFGDAYDPSADRDGA